MTRPVRAATAPGQQGMALITVLWTVALLSVLVLSSVSEWRTEMKLAVNFVQERQCRRLAEAGIYYALGKLVAVKLAEVNIDSGGQEGNSPGIWRVDGSPHLLELPEGRVEVRVFDEAGKINLNQAPENLLMNLFVAQGFTERESQGMAEAIVSWRGTDYLAPPSGPDNQFYLQQAPPYSVKNGLFDSVEELFWVRGFINPSRPGRFTESLTVQDVGTGVNINTAPPEVLRAFGFPAEVAEKLVNSRAGRNWTSWEEVVAVAGLPPTFNLLAAPVFNSSFFYTILATGMVGSHEAQHTIKAIVKIQLDRPTPWTILYWADDYPG